jgi:hypothetical protein
MRKVFDIYINEKPFPVFNIEGKEHTYGKNNGCVPTWWLDYTKDQNGDYAPASGIITEITENRKLIPYIDKGVHRICWEVIYKQSNLIRYKWDEYDIRSTGSCTLRANGRDVYKFRNSDLQSAMTQVQYLTEKIISHPYNFFRPEEDDGRKIYYKSLPAFVRTGFEVGEITIEPDYSILSKEKWWEIHRLFSKKYESKDSIFREFPDEEEEQELGFSDTINWGDALSDGFINWFRG